MTATQIRDLTLREVHEQFGLRLTQAADFFLEWQVGLPELSAAEQTALTEIQMNYLDQSEEVMHENAVKMVVLSPLLSLAGFYRKPFRISAEKTIKIQATDAGKVYRGVIDVLVLHRQLWVLVVESKRNTFSLEAAKPQALTYMLANPVAGQPTFGLVTNGINFRFIKVLGQEYAESDDFYLRNQEDIGRVLKIMKHLGWVVSQMERSQS
ncbi:MAG: restriction endonuclease subunit R [Leptolyngbya sp. Prado105]|nr:restriction endonuclease subunit R [Leptolyngbya sp. Prado105]